MTLKKIILALQIVAFCIVGLSENIPSIQISVNPATYEVTNDSPPGVMVIETEPSLFHEKDYPYPQFRLIPRPNLNECKIVMEGNPVILQADILLRWRKYPELLNGNGFPSVIRRFLQYEFLTENQQKGGGEVSLPIDLTKIPLDQWVNIHFVLTIPAVSNLDDRIISVDLNETRSLQVYHAASAAGNIAPFSLDLAMNSLTMNGKEQWQDPTLKNPNNWLTMGRATLKRVDLHTNRNSDETRLLLKKIFPDFLDFELTGPQPLIQSGAVLFSSGSVLKSGELALQPLIELQLHASGSGTATVHAGSVTRTMKISPAGGLYGVLFPAESSNTAIEIQFSGEVLLSKGELVPATSEQASLWKAAQESFSLLGYYGRDPQRPLPGKKLEETGNQLPILTPEQIESFTIRETIVFYDPEYDANWVTNVHKVAEYFEGCGLPILNAADTEKWLNEKAIQRADGTSLIAVMGNAPQRIFHAPYEKSPLAQYLKNGGRVVWAADIPLYYSQDDTGLTLALGSHPRSAFLGLECDRQMYYGINETAILSNAAKIWGLEPGLSLMRPVNNRNLEVTFTTDSSGQYAGHGMVNFKPENPLSGFIFVPDPLSNENHALLRNLYRLARFSGTKVTVPEVIPNNHSKISENFQLKFDPENLRFCFLRSEQVPIFLDTPDQDEYHINLTLKSNHQVVRQWTGKISGKLSSELTKWSMKDLKRAKYTLEALVNSKSGKFTLQRELRIGIKPDHDGIHLGLWVSESPKVQRSENLLQWLHQNDISPVFTEEHNVGRDLTLWWGGSFSTRLHGKYTFLEPKNGFDSYRRGSSGKVMRIRAEGDKRESRSYANPETCRLEAEDFAAKMAFNNRFPAFRQRALTADDYSQWFGLDYNRFIVEGFTAEYKIDPPVFPETEDPYSSINIPRIQGIIPDGDPWLLLNKYWSRNILGGMGKRLSNAMADATGGKGLVGPVPGAMQIPVLSMWSAQYPPFNFGENGFSLNCFYYYNCFWQPPLAHLWWLECARMGNRNMEQWIVPDCYVSNLESYFQNNAWLMMAGGAVGMEYFVYSADFKEEALKAMKRWGKAAKDYGLLLKDLRPARKSVGMLVPFETVVHRIERCFELAYPFMNMLLAHIDVEPVSPEELNAENINEYQTLVLAGIPWLTQRNVNLLDRFIAGGGNVLIDQNSAEEIKIKNATILNFNIGENLNLTSYNQQNNIDAIRSAFAASQAIPVSCNSPNTVIRRFVDSSGCTWLWLVDNYSQSEFQHLKKIWQENSQICRNTENELGYRKTILDTEISFHNTDSLIAFDVFAGEKLELKRDGKLYTFRTNIPKWDGKLIALLPAVAKEVTLAPSKASVQPGEKVTLAIQTNPAVRTQLQLKVFDPNGEENLEYFGRLLTTPEGKGIFSIEFAANDLPGTWRLEIIDTMTNCKTEGTVSLNNLGAR